MKSAARKRNEKVAKANPVDGLTVGWMMTLVTALICELAAIASRAYVRFMQTDAPTLRMLAGLLLFASAVIGFVLLVLTPIVVMRKRSNPPRGIVVFAYAIGAAPLVAMLLQGTE